MYSKASSSKQADKFTALWNGEIPDGKSHSEADMALAEILAFLCGGDIEQMDRLFRRSGLMRDKWGRAQSGTTYGMLTLAKAVEKCNAFYSPMTTSAEEDFNEILPKLMELDPAVNKRYRSGDIGYGRLFADMFKDIVRYVPERKKWFVYDGKRWKADIANLSIMELGKDLADGLENRVAELKKLMADEKESSINVDHFLSIVRKYTDVKELNAEIIREFVEKIYIHQMERIDGHKVQRIRIVWNCIGEFTPPSDTGHEKTA